MVGLYIMYYYTNILGVSAAVAGTIFMVARLVDEKTMEEELVAKRTAAMAAQE